MTMNTLQYSIPSNEQPHYNSTSIINNNNNNTDRATTSDSCNSVAMSMIKNADYPNRRPSDSNNNTISKLNLLRKSSDESVGSFADYDTKSIVVDIGELLKLEGLDLSSSSSDDDEDDEVREIIIQEEERTQHVEAPDTSGGIPSNTGVVSTSTNVINIDNTDENTSVSEVVSLSSFQYESDLEDDDDEELLFHDSMSSFQLHESRSSFNSSGSSIVSLSIRFSSSSNSTQLNYNEEQEIQPSSPTKKHVRFGGEVAVREYNLTIGACDPTAGAGTTTDTCLIQLGWEHSPERRIPTKRFINKQKLAISNFPRRLTPNERRQRIANVQGVTIDQVRELELSNVLLSIDEIMKTLSSNGIDTTDTTRDTQTTTKQE